MPLFFPCGWIIPLIFLSVFLICFLTSQRSFKCPMFSHHACSHASGKKVQDEKDDYNKKIHDLKSDIECLKRNASSENKEPIKEQLLQMERDLERFKKELFLGQNCPN
ncbi:hypothetical protein [Tindallia californiensis]|uniref:Uncharacterized protein n=1 Tax=Tindallia californiensis TaxID=159292 RepID=A0A1H3RAM5_9FIRM|nr:hypothetical protein [Tindallia californiensis]SDZ22700.1 hypothetical protein SAMN05192546_11514 [Tindallia californiensis]